MSIAFSINHAKFQVSSSSGTFLGRTLGEVCQDEFPVVHQTFIFTTGMKECPIHPSLSFLITIRSFYIPDDSQIYPDILHPS